MDRQMNPKLFVSSATTLTVTLLTALFLGPLTNGVEGVKCYVNTDSLNVGSTMTTVDTTYSLIKKAITTKDEVELKEKFDKSDTVIRHDEGSDTTTATPESMAFTAKGCVTTTLRCTAELQTFQKNFFEDPSVDTSKYKQQICTDAMVESNAVWQKSYGAVSGTCSDLESAYADIDPDSFNAVMKTKLDCCATDACNAPPGAPTSVPPPPPPPPVSSAMRSESQLLLPLLLAAGAVMFGLTL